MPAIGEVQGPVHPSLPPRHFVDAESTLTAPDGLGVVASLVILHSDESRAGWVAFLVKMEGEPATVVVHSPLLLYWFPAGGQPLELTSRAWIGLRDKDPAFLRAQGDRLLTACFGGDAWGATRSWRRGPRRRWIRRLEADALAQCGGATRSG
ncbi:MAG: hypothetical protein AUK47_12810 [Deltaproteobacteria bacterium CG2_30_63_29]|nr:MAG: hypothetical protein AUK47_12810 [Deltaproteobacteria bacterium CG2_30_63_29]PJB40794.1 MAG: hypothetical protein CO108_14050 [Deltaproteobacteria bacterium CG_4_9_14_3_um_filter_63_12]